MPSENSPKNSRLCCITIGIAGATMFVA